MRKQGDLQVGLDVGGELQTRIKDIVWQRREHFQDLLNQASMSSIEETESDDLGEDSSITLVEVVEGIKKISHQQSTGVGRVSP